MSYRNSLHVSCLYFSIDELNTLLLINTIKGEWLLFLCLKISNLVSISIEIFSSIKKNNEVIIIITSFSMMFNSDKEIFHMSCHFKLRWYFVRKWERVNERILKIALQFYVPWREIYKQTGYEISREKQIKYIYRIPR